MIRFRLPELLAEAQFKTGRRITVNELSDATSISRITLSRMLNVRGYNTTTDTIDKLCKFFGCTTAEVVVYVGDEEASAATAVASQRRGQAAPAAESDPLDSHREVSAAGTASPTKTRRHTKKAET